MGCPTNLHKLHIILITVANRRSIRGWCCLQMGPEKHQEKKRSSIYSSAFYVQQPRSAVAPLVPLELELPLEVVLCHKGTNRDCNSATGLVRISDKLVTSQNHIVCHVTRELWAMINHFSFIDTYWPPPSSDVCPSLLRVPTFPNEPSLYQFTLTNVPVSLSSAADRWDVWRHRPRRPLVFILL